MYKFELRHIVDILNSPKNIGTNQWVVNTGGSLEATDSYLYAIRSRNQSSWLRSYWESYLKSVSRLSRQGAAGALDSIPSSGEAEVGFVGQTQDPVLLADQVSSKPLSWGLLSQGWAFNPSKASYSAYASFSQSDSSFF